MFVDSIELSIESFFNQTLVNRGGIERLLVQLFEQKASLEIGFEDNVVRLTLCATAPVMTLAGDIKEEFKFLDGQQLNSLFLPVLLNIERLVIPHFSFTSISLDSSLDNFVIKTVYSHLLRGLPVTMEDSGEATDALTLGYFYYLRWAFPSSFDNRRGEYAYLLSSVATRYSVWEDALFVLHANAITDLEETPKESAFHGLVKDRLLLVRDRLLEVI
jgi:hypothetical protein